MSSGSDYRRLNPRTDSILAYSGSVLAYDSWMEKHLVAYSSQLALADTPVAHIRVQFWPRTHEFDQQYQEPENFVFYIQLIET
ncbi:hypothetical protein ACJIZ3_006357 [Penstemon smallii]|uniref:Uncharacterized protein n=1 Tax=Penstemon smallii TaxID=265156 RepID=A0ABD3S7K7_9LAMI